MKLTGLLRCAHFSRDITFLWCLSQQEMPPAHKNTWQDRRLFLTFAVICLISCGMLCTDIVAQCSTSQFSSCEVILLVASLRHFNSDDTACVHSVQCTVQELRNRQLVLRWRELALCTFERNFRLDTFLRT